MNAPLPTDLVFVEDAQPAAAERAAARPWNVLIVDDDPDVHEATALALRGLDIHGRPLAFLHARSAAEARQLLSSARDIAVVLLDVVMETADAGLRLVEHIRSALGWRDTRIILRTGQPGYAPELAAIREYDINDYRTKSELTRNRLVTTLTAALRSYQQIRAIDAARRGLDLIARATPQHLARRDLADFASGVLAQLAALLDVPADGVVCVFTRDASSGPTRVAASGRCALAGGVEDGALRALLQQARAQCRSARSDHGVALWLGEHAGVAAVAALVAAPESVPEDLHLLDVFGSNAAVCLNNLRLLEQLRTVAYEDALVGLPNRLGLIEALDGRAAVAERERQTLALIDIDRFAEINNALGHGFGDRLLQAVARQLRDRLDPSCFVARVSNDLFAALGPHDHVNPHRLRYALGAAVDVGRQRQPLSFTLGLLRLADGAGTGADLLMDASIALKHAKQVARGHERYYSPDMGIEIRARVRLLDDLRDAIGRERLFVVYQPQLDLATGRALGAEALLRWRNDEGAFVPPDRFIPLAEHSGLIIELGDWVLRSACAFQRRLHLSGLSGFRIAVNLSVAQFRDPRLLERIGSAIAASGIDPRCLELEITESVAMTGESHMLATFAQLRALGVHLAIDDFGTGYSSLGYLRQMQVDRLKIDRSFVQELGGGGDGSIARMVVQLGRTLGLRVIAEGVESEGQAQALRELGCDEAQGFLYARPMPHDELVAWLQARRC